MGNACQDRLWLGETPIEVQACRAAWVAIFVEGIEESGMVDGVESA